MGRRTGARPKLDGSGTPGHQHGPRSGRGDDLPLPDVIRPGTAVCLPGAADMARGSLAVSGTPDGGDEASESDAAAPAPEAAAPVDATIPVPMVDAMIPIPDTGSANLAALEPACGGVRHEQRRSFPVFMGDALSACCSSSCAKLVRLGVCATVEFDCRVGVRHLSRESGASGGILRDLGRGSVRGECDLSAVRGVHVGVLAANRLFVPPAAMLRY